MGFSGGGGLVRGLEVEKSLCLTYSVAFQWNVHQASGGRVLPPLAPKGFPLGAGDFTSSSFSISVTGDGLCLSL